MPARIAPATPPFPENVQKQLDRLMPPGIPPLTLFVTMARDERLFGRFMGAGLLDKGHLTLRQREIVIDRVTAQNGSEYEWGVHVAFFAERVGFTDAQLHSLVHGSPVDDCWTEDERLLLRMCDQLHETAAIGDDLWQELAARFTAEAILELLLLAGFYRTVSYLANALHLPLESYGSRFPPAG